MTDATNDIKLYLAALNTALAVGVRSRGRILVEVGEHLQEAADREHDDLRAQAERRALPAAEADAWLRLWTDAQRRVIAAFGTPEEVAAGFERGRLQALDRRLALIDAGSERWLSRRPVLGGTIWAGMTSLAWVVMGLAIAGVGALFGVGYLVNVMMPMVVAAVVAFGLRMAYVLRGLRSAGGMRAQRGCGLFSFGLPVAVRDFVPFLFFIGYMMVADPISYSLWVNNWIVLVALVELVAQVARRRGHRGAWGAYERDDPEANWSRYLAGLWTATGVTLTLILLHSASLSTAGTGHGTSDPLGLGGAVGLLLVAFTGVHAVFRRLAFNSAVKREWDRMYGAGPAAAG